MSTDRLMGPAELAEYLGIPQKTLYMWRTRSEGPVASKIGKHLRWQRADVDAFVESCKRPA